MEQIYQSNFLSHLHSVRKQPFKTTKKPIAPLPPVPPKVYKVDSNCFKQVVQELTAGPGYRPRRLRSLAPPPISLSATTTTVATTAESRKDITLELLPSLSVTPTWSNVYKELMSEGDLEMGLPRKQSDDVTFNSPGLGLSTASYGWCSLPLLSPGTLNFF